MMNKKAARMRRATKTRKLIKEKKQTRLCIYRSPRHIYAQVISADGEHVIAAASTVEKELKAGGGSTGNVEAAKAVGKLIAERAKEKGVSRLAFDRSGFKYHGRIKALADTARENGLEF